MDALLRQYQELVRDVETAMIPLLARHRENLHCVPGCTECCQALSLLAIEARVVGAAFRALPATEQEAIRAQGQAPGDHCPFLRQRLCAIYPARPLICRTHGLAIGYVDEEREVIEVSACPHNFDGDYPFDSEDLLFLDPFNDRLALLNQQFAQATGVEATARVAMADIIHPTP